MPIATPQKREKVGMGFTDIGPMAFLYDANDVANYIADTASVTLARDLSGNNFHMTNSGATCPTLALNRDGKGNAAMVFNGTSQFLASLDSDPLDDKLSSNYTFFAVLKSTSDNGGNQVYYSKYNNSTGVQGPTFEAYRLAANDIKELVYATNAAGSNPYGYRGSTNLLNNLGIIVATHSIAPAQTAYFNSVAETLTVVSSTGNGQFAGNTSPGYLGALATAGAAKSLFFSGDMYVIGCYVGVLSTTQRDALTRRLSARFQIAAPTVMAPASRNVAA